MGKFSALLIGLTIVCGIIALFGLSFSSSSTYFNKSYDNNTLVSMNKLEKLNNYTTSLQGNISKIGDKDSTISDVIGALLSSGYNTVRSFFTSFTLTSEFASSSVDALGVGQSTQTLKTIVIMILSIFIFVGIVLTVILNRDNL